MNEQPSEQRSYESMAIAPQRAAIGIRRHFTTEGVHPYDEVVWERRDARITNFRDGTVAFEQLGVEVPAFWSTNATNILAQKYFRGTLGTPERESSLKQVADRVADSITAWGIKDGYFVDRAEADIFRDELKHLIIHQKAAFNSPVWFNIGVRGAAQQASACFILSVDDSMDSILNWYVEEGIIFKGGSGAGVNLSRIRASNELLKGGGTASGPVSFMRGADASAGTIKSGGKSRRAAKMVILDADHPDIEDFIWCKAIEERKARVLRDAGFDMDLDGSDSHSTQYQNANNSVRVTDEFMQAVLADGEWDLTARTDGSVIRRVKARDLFRQIAHAAWECADPGMQFDTTINSWHTAPNTGRINGSNPCSEYMHLDNSACNLASLNLLKFLNEDGSFDVEGFKAGVEVVFTGQEILVGNADYPTEKIAENSRKFRELGIGYANLGALLMANGLPYDSDGGRAWAGAITALMTGHAYATSAKTASRMGPFAGFHDNAEPMMSVLRMHQTEASKIDEELVPPELLSAAQQAWDEAVELAEQFGVRNSQASVLAPTGTIGLLMDCDTTGVEPDLGLVKTKKLVGGGTMSIVNQTIPRALRQLGYGHDQIDQIVAYIDEHKTIVGAPDLSADHLPVFACSMGDNTIHYSGHVRMMGAVQPFISGAISKCVTGDTLIPTDDGLVRIASFYEGEEPDTFRSEHVLVASLGGSQKTDAFYFGGERDAWRIRLRSGHKVTGTPNHRVLVVDGSGLTWKRLDGVEVGDEVAVRYGADMWSPAAPLITDPHLERHGGRQHVRVPEELTEDLAFLLGVYSSEGCTVKSGSSIRITNADAVVLDRIAQAADRAFDGSVTARVRSPKEGCQFVEIHSNTVVELFEVLGCGHRPSEKRIPDIVLRAPKSHVLAFLQGLSLDASTQCEPMAKWAICTDSAQLLDDLQSVLTNLGIVHGRIAKLNRVNGETYDEVYACGPYAQKMVRLVPFLEPDKATSAARLLERTHDQDTADVVPGVSGPDLYRLIPKQHQATFRFLLEAPTTCTSRHTLERVASIEGVELPSWLRSVLNDGLHFSPAVEASAAGRRVVYDLSVPATHAFVGNGIVNHNTVNMPEDVTVEDVEQLHIDAWRLGIKAVAIYRDNCKVAQPLSTTKKEGKVVEGGDTAPPGSEAEAKDREAAARIAELEKALEHERRTKAEPVVVGAIRERLPRRRRSNTFAFRVADCEGYVTVGEYEDGRPGEVFVKVSKQGSTLAGIMDAFSISISLGLQHGVPLATYVRKYSNMKFEPAGITDDAELRIATSLVDYIFRRLALDYLTYEERLELGVMSTSERIQPTLPGVEESATPSVGVVDTGPVVETRPPAGSGSPSASAPRTSPGVATGALARAEQRDAPFCYSCGNVMQRAGSCYVCAACGSTSGCS
jgi:adenosylcobalamin-dependent ribonucleoside-diphosphate reductase